MMTIAVRIMVCVVAAALLVVSGCSQPAATDPAALDAGESALASGASGDAAAVSDSGTGELDKDAVSAVLAQLQGTWVIAGVEYQGEELAGLEGTRAVIEGDEVTIESAGAKAVSKMTLDTSKDPAWMDTSSSGGTTLAIYKLDGEQLWICAGPANAGTDRPADFVTAADSEAMLFQYTRAAD